MHFAEVIRVPAGTGKNSVHGKIIFFSSNIALLICVDCRESCGRQKGNFAETACNSYGRERFHLRLMRTKLTIGAVAMLSLSGLGGAQELVNGGGTILGRLSLTGSASSVDFTASGSTAPVKTGTMAARPGSCTVGQFYLATDASAGQGLSYCSSAGVWSGIASASSGAGVATATVSYSSTPAFAVSASTAVQSFQITLTGNVSSSTLNTANATAGQFLVWSICQDATGARTFSWPANVTGGGKVEPAANACSSQAFTFDGTNTVARGPLTVTGVGSGAAASSLASTLGISAGIGGTAAGSLDLSAGPAPAVQGAGTFRLYAPTSIPSAYGWKVPAADAAGAVASDGAGNLSVTGFSGTGSVARTNSPVFTTPNLGAATATSINGWTPPSSLTAHGTVVGNGTGAPSAVAPGTAGYVWTSNGPSADPSWQAAASGSGGGGISTSNVAFSTTPIFTIAGSTSIQHFTFPFANPPAVDSWTGNVTASTLATTNATNGQLVSFQICQDVTGTVRTFAWPSNVTGAGTIDPTQGACSYQLFKWDAAAGYLKAETPMTSSGSTGAYAVLFGNGTYVDAPASSLAFHLPAVAGTLALERTGQFTWNELNPNANDVIRIGTTAFPIHLNSTECAITGSTSATINLDVRTAMGTDSGSHLLASDLTATTSETTGSTWSSGPCGGTSSCGVAAGKILVGIVTGLSGTPAGYSCTVFWTADH